MGLPTAYAILRFLLYGNSMTRQEILDTAVNKYGFDLSYIRGTIDIIMDLDCHVRVLSDGRLYLTPGFREVDINPLSDFWEANPRRRRFYEEYNQKFGCRSTEP